MLWSRSIANRREAKPAGRSAFPASFVQDRRHLFRHDIVEEQRFATPSSRPLCQRPRGLRIEAVSHGV